MNSLDESAGIDLPQSLTEYILIWCADLLRDLSAAQRQMLLKSILMGYEGGPWPRRLHIQRLAEQIGGTIDVDAVTAEIATTYGPNLDETVKHLANAEDSHMSRHDLITHLARHLTIGGLLSRVTAAHDAGVLNFEEFIDIYTHARSMRVLPPPKDPPPEFPAVPADFPESYEEYRRREPPAQEVPPST